MMLTIVIRARFLKVMGSFWDCRGFIVVNERTGKRAGCSVLLGIHEAQTDAENCIELSEAVLDDPMSLSESVYLSIEFSS